MLKFVLAVAPNNKGAINISKPAFWVLCSGGQNTRFERLHKKFAITELRGLPMATPSVWS